MAIGREPRFRDEEWAWVSGASSGIGRAVALRLAGEGVGVCLSARREDPLNEIAAVIREAGGRAETLVADFGDPETVAAAAKQMSERTEGRMDIVVPCAGMELLLPFPLLSPARMEKLSAVHLTGALEMVRTSLPFMKKAVAEGEGAQGRVVLISSIAALRGYPVQTAYSACKAGLLGAMGALAVELAPYHIRVNAVSPGMVLGPMQERMFAKMPPESREAFVARYPLGLGLPADIADAVAFLASNEARWITGLNLVVDGGASVAG